MREVDAAFFERICKPTELTAVIAGNAPEDLGEGIAIHLAQKIQASRCAGFCLTGNLYDAATADHSFIQGEQHFSGCALPDDRIDLPMPELLTLVHCIRTILYALSQNPAILSAMMAFVIPSYAKWQIYALYADDPEIDVVVHGLGANHFSKLAGQFCPAANRIGRELILQHGSFHVSQEGGCIIHFIGLTTNCAMLFKGKL